MYSVTYKFDAMKKEMYIEEIKDGWFECATEDSPELLFNFYKRYKGILYEFWDEGENQYMIDLYNTLCEESDKVYSYGAREIMQNPEILKIWQKWNYAFNHKQNLMKRDADLKARLTIILYDQLKEYEDDINFVGHRAKFNQEHRIYNTDKMKQVLELYSIFEEYHAKYEYIRDMFEDTQKPLDNETQKFVLPPELNSPIAQTIFSKAIEEGYISQKGDLLQWHKSNALLAYFCGRLFCGDVLTFEVGSERPLYKRAGKLPETAIMGVFLDQYGKKLPGLSDSRRQLSYAPFGYEIIDELFDEAAC